MNDKIEYQIDQRRIPAWLCPAEQLLSLIRDCKVDFPPWHILNFDLALSFSSTISSLFGRELYTFAYRQDNDDFACFENGYSDLVRVIDSGAAKGFESVRDYSFEKWLDTVRSDMDEWL